MKKILLAMTLVLSSSVFADQTASKSTADTAPVAKITADKKVEDPFKLIHVKDLENLMATQKNNVYIYDANNIETRQKDGIIPGAKPLQYVSKYDVGQTLPTDKNASLVFYCANTMCKASHEAAKRAVQNGYKNVSVMADGIEGWKKAGKATEKYTSKL